MGTGSRVPCLRRPSASADRGHESHARTSVDPVTSGSPCFRSRRCTDANGADACPRRRSAPGWSITSSATSTAGWSRLLTRQFGLRHLDLVEDMVQSALVRGAAGLAAAGRCPTSRPPGSTASPATDVLDALRRARARPAAGPRPGGRALPRKARATPASDDDLFLDSRDRGQPAAADLRLRPSGAAGRVAHRPDAQDAVRLQHGRGRPRPARSARRTPRSGITRAKQQLVDENIALEVPPAAKLAERLETVHAVLYLMFNEGYTATDSDQAIRRDLCAEAARLCHLLTLHRHCSTPATLALLALMLFHAARFDARLDRDGCLLLLEEQDRSRWDYGLIKQAIDYLTRSAAGRADHLLSPRSRHRHVPLQGPAASPTPTGRAILRHYDLLLQLQRSPIYLLNRAIALAQRRGPRRPASAPSPRSATIRSCATTTCSTPRWASCTAGPAICRAAEHFRTAWRKTQIGTGSAVAGEKVGDVWREIRAAELLTPVLPISSQ